MTPHKETELPYDAPSFVYAPLGDKLLMLWAVLTWQQPWLALAQTPPVDPSFFASWDRLGIVGILVAVIVFGTWFFMKLLNRESGRGDKLDATNLELVRQHEHMSLEFISAVRELSQEVKALQQKCGELERELALLHARLGRAP